jgi:hypothetical protein
VALFTGFIVKTILPAHLVVSIYGIEVNEWKFYWRAVPVESEEEGGDDKAKDDKES